MNEWLKEKSLIIILGISLSLVFVLGLWMFQRFQSPRESALNDKQLLIEEQVVESAEKVAGSLKKEYVDIKGAVKKPGMYQIDSQTRLIEGIELAGGFTSEADTKQINFAQVLVDQMVIYVPEIGEEMPSNSIVESREIADSQSELININRADLAELQKLTGVGAVKAAAIIAYREEHGSFQSMDDLSKINGFGQKSVEKLTSEITF